MQIRAVTAKRGKEIFVVTLVPRYHFGLGDRYLPPDGVPDMFGMQYRCDIVGAISSSLASVGLQARRLATVNLIKGVQRRV